MGATDANASSGFGDTGADVQWTFGDTNPGQLTQLNGTWYDEDGFELSPKSAQAYLDERDQINYEAQQDRNRQTRVESDDLKLRRRAEQEWSELYKGGAVTWEQHPGRLDSSDPAGAWLKVKKELDRGAVEALLDAGGAGKNFVSDSEHYVKVLADREAAFSMSILEISRHKVEQDPWFQETVSELRYTVGELRRRQGLPDAPRPTEIDQVLEQARAKHWAKERDRAHPIPEHAKPYLKAP